MNSNKNLIYVLCCPITNEVHYVGKSTCGLLRPMQHVSEFLSKKIKEWVNDLNHLNYQPIIKIVEYVFPVDDLDNRERYWIQYFLNKGCSLLNEKIVTPLIINPNLDKILIGDNDQNLSIIQISRFIKERRKAVKLNQKDFAEKIGIDVSVIRKIEQGKTNYSFDALLLVLNIFGCSLDIIKQELNH